MPAYIHIVFEKSHTHSNVRLTTAASETEGVRTWYHIVVACENNSVLTTPLSLSAASMYTAVHMCRVFFFFGGM